MQAIKEKFPKYALLYWSSVYSEGSSKTLYLFRLITQIFTKSNLEHCAVCQVIPQDIKTQVVRDNHAYTEIKQNNFYVFESNKNYGNIVQSIDKRLNYLLDKKIKWSGTVFIQPVENIKLLTAANDNLDNLKKPYTIGSAIFCAVDETRLGKWLYKILNMKKKVSVYNHCSASNFINIQKAMEQKIDRELAIATSPEELCNYLIKNYNADAPKPLLKIENGSCLWYDKQLLTNQ